MANLNSSSSYEPNTPSPFANLNKIVSSIGSLFGGKNKAAVQTANTAVSVPPASAPQFSTAPPQGQYFQWRDPTTGTFIGISEQIDPASGKPYFAYQIPGQATTTDPTRIAPMTNPMVAQPTPYSDFENPRLPENISSSVRSALKLNPEQQLDHAFAVALGGSNDPSNLVGVSTMANQAASPNEGTWSSQVAGGQLPLFQAQINEAQAKGQPIPWTDQTGTINTGITEYPAYAVSPKETLPQSQTATTPPGPNLSSDLLSQWKSGMNGGISTSTPSPSLLDQWKSGNVVSNVSSPYVTTPATTLSQSGNFALGQPIDISATAKTQPLTGTEVLRNYPSALGGGQYVLDTANPNLQIKNTSVLDKTTQQKILGTLSPNFYSVDHIVPLWIGGTDNAANLQILDNPTASMKNAIQAVPYTLLANGQITLNQAKDMALTWSGKNGTGLPSPDANGLLPLSVAQQYEKKWVDQAANPEPVNLTNVMKYIPQNAQDFGKGWLPDPIREFAKGLLQGGTAGIVPADQSPNEGVDSDIAHLAGNIVGMGTGIGALGDLFRGATLTYEGIGMGLGTGEAAGLSRGLDMAGKAMTDAGLGNVTTAATETGLVNSSPWIATLKEAAKDAGLFGLWGEIGLGGRQITGQQQATLSNYMSTFFTNAAYGAILGASGQSIKGYLGVGLGTTMLALMEGQNMQNALKNGALMTGLHLMGLAGGNFEAGGGWTKYDGQLNDIMMNGADKKALTTLNQWDPNLVDLAKKGDVMPKQRTFDIPKYEQMRQDYIVANPDDPSITSIPEIKTQQDVTNFMEKAALNKFTNYKIGAKEEMSPEVEDAEIFRIGTAARHLYTTTLEPEVQQLIRRSEDFHSIGRALLPQTTFNNMGTGSANLADLVQGIPLKFPDQRFQMPADKVPADFPSGNTIVTGVSDKINGVDKGNLEHYDQTPHNTSDKIFLVSDPQTVSYLKLKNYEYQINSKAVLKIDPNFKPINAPEDGLRAYYFEDDGKGPGGRSLKSVGYSATAERIGSRKFNINENYDAMMKRVRSIITNAKDPQALMDTLNKDMSRPSITLEDANNLIAQKKIIRTMSDRDLLTKIKASNPLQKFDAGLNNSSIAQAMRDNNLKILTTNVVKLTQTKSGNPFMILRIDPQNFLESAAFRDGQIEKSVPQLTDEATAVQNGIKNVTANQNAQNVAQTAGNISARVSEPEPIQPVVTPQIQLPSSQYAAKDITRMAKSMMMSEARVRQLIDSGKLKTKPLFETYNPNIATLPFTEGSTEPTTVPVPETMSTTDVLAQKIASIAPKPTETTDVSSQVQTAPKIEDLMKQDTQLFKGVGKDIPNINRMAYGIHFADNPEVAKEYGTVIKGDIIPKGERVANLDVIKQDYAQKQILADPKQITQVLIDNGYKWAKGTLPGKGLEYIKLEGSKTGWNNAGDWMPGEPIQWIGGEDPENSKFVITDKVDKTGEATGRYSIYDGKTKELVKTDFNSIGDATNFVESQLKKETDLTPVRADRVQYQNLENQIRDITQKATDEGRSITTGKNSEYSEIKALQDRMSSLVKKYKTLPSMPKVTSPINAPYESPLSGETYEGPARALTAASLPFETPEQQRAIEEATGLVTEMNDPKTDLQRKSEIVKQITALGDHFAGQPGTEGRNPATAQRIYNLLNEPKTPWKSQDQQLAEKYNLSLKPDKTGQFMNLEMKSGQPVFDKNFLDANPELKGKNPLDVSVGLKSDLDALNASKTRFSRNFLKGIDKMAQDPNPEAQVGGKLLKETFKQIKEKTMEKYPDLKGIDWTLGSFLKDSSPTFKSMFSETDPRTGYSFSQPVQLLIDTVKGASPEQISAINEATNAKNEEAMLARASREGSLGNEIQSTGTSVNRPTIGYTAAELKKMTPTELVKVKQDYDDRLFYANLTGGDYDPEEVSKMSVQDKDEMARQRDLLRIEMNAPAATGVYESITGEKAPIEAIAKDWKNIALNFVKDWNKKLNVKGMKGISVDFKALQKSVLDSLPKTTSDGGGGPGPNGQGGPGDIIDSIRNFFTNTMDFKNPNVSPQVPVNLPLFLKAIANNETGNMSNASSSYQSSNLGSLGNALGTYRVTQGELKSYAPRYLGRPVTTKEFLSSPSLQDSYMINKAKYLSAQGFTPEQIADMHNKGVTNSYPPGSTQYQNPDYVNKLDSVYNQTEISNN